ncbi:MAG: response regulator [Treponema sp.]|jgi:signal transduction histidine kinase/CheY-like chemotaxis protein|nr:response regulator [Treponema sp.]
MDNRAVFMEGKRTGWFTEAKKLKKPAEGRPPITWRYNLLFYGFLSIILIGGSMAFILSMRQFVRLSAGDELIRMLEMAKVRLESSMNNEVALALKMADSPLIKRYFQNPGDMPLQKTALEEIDGYRRAFASHSVFWVTDVDKAFYFDGGYKYTVDPDDPETYWYTMTLYETERYNFNINYNAELNMTNIWINVPVYDQQKPLGILGTSMDLFAFNAAYYGDEAGRGSLYFFNKAGEITCAWDAGLAARKETINTHLGGLGEQLLAWAREGQESSAGEIRLFNTAQGEVGVGAIPALGWYIAAVMPLTLRDSLALVLNSRQKIEILMQILSIFAVFLSTLICLRRFRREAVRAYEAGAAKSRFLAQISHEIRTPLNAIIGMSEMAVRSNSFPEILDCARKIKHAGNNLLTLINDVMDFSKLEAGSLRIVEAPYALAAVLHGAIHAARARITNKAILFMVTVDASLPAHLLGDEARIRQVLLHLLSNAVKFTPQGSIALKVSQEPSGDPKQRLMLRLEVSDTGIGIKEADRNRLFGDFVRLDRARNTSIEGTGMGLALTRRICRAMGGTVWVTSRYGQGSVFTAVFPQRRIPGDDEPFAAAQDPQSKKVLVYEHRTAYAGSIQAALYSLDVPFTAVAGAEEFLQELAGPAPAGGTAYYFAFVSPPLLEAARKLIQDRNLTTRLALLAGLEETPVPENTAVLPMPVYADTIASLLNREPSPLGGKTGEPELERFFTAPDARILVVDDIPTNIKVAGGFLAPYQAAVDTCLSGAEALELVKRREYDLIFMDHMMPDMDGIRTAAAIREWEQQPGHTRRQVPIVVLTANAVLGVKNLYLEKGFNAYLAKPIETAKLNAIMRAWIPREKQLQKGAAETERKGLLDGVLVPGVDLEKGKRQYREEAYLEVLRSYGVHIPALLEKLRRLTGRPFSPETLREYAITVHGLKGSTYGICADGTAEKAEALELAARNGELQYVETHNGALIEEAAALAQNLREALQRLAGQQEEPKPQAEAPDMVLLQKLAGACKAYKASLMEHLLKELEQYNYTSGNDLVAWLREQADNLEYEAIWKRLEGLLNESPVTG